MKRRGNGALALSGLAMTILLAAAVGSPRPVPETTTAHEPGQPATPPAPSSGSSNPPGIAAGPTGIAATPTAAPGSSAGPSPSPTDLVPADPTQPVEIAPPSAPAGRPTTPGATVPPATPPPTPAVTVAPTQPPTTPGPIPPLSACSVFPSSNVWNRRIDTLPVAADSDALIAALGLGSSLHPDFSAAGGYGIPYNVVGASTPRSTVSFEYDDESDHVGYPIPSAPKIEGGSDRHVLLVDTDACLLYELYAASKGASGWSAGSGAVWDLGSNALRPDGWTSADAAGLPIFPGLVRYAEVAAGAIRHAIRFTAPKTCDGHLYPARHDAGSGSCDSRPPMGLRVRLQASVDISGYGPQSRVILTALQRYGMLLADNGSAWYITGAPDSHWDDDELHGLGGISGADFEVVDTTGLVNG